MRFAFCVVALATACADKSSAPQPGAESASSSTRAPGVPFDLSDVVQRARARFRPGASGVWEGGHTSYYVRVRAGAVQIEPLAPSPTTPASPPLRVETIQIGRDDAPCVPVAAMHVQVADDGHLLLARRAATEHLSNREGGLEQSWSFARKPVGLGDLEVRVHTAGMAYVRTSRDGVHFVDRETRLGVRYGHASWVDAAGEVTAIETQYRQGDLVLRVPARIVDRSEYPAALDPLVSPEIPVDIASSGTPAPGAQLAPKVAFAGGVYLVAWTDSMRPGTSDRDVYVARVSRSGVAVDPNGIRITTTTGDYHTPKVATDGTTFLVAWNGAGATYGARVAPSGAVLDPGGRFITGGFAPEALAGSATGYLLVGLRTGTSGPDVVAIRLSTAGDALDATPIVVGPDDAGRNLAAEVAFDGTSYAVVWSNDPTGIWFSSLRVYMARVSTGGALLDSPPIILTLNTNSGEYLIDVACGPASCLAVWPQRGIPQGIVGVRFMGSTVIDAAAVSLSGDVFGWGPTIASRGSDYVVAWTGTPTLLDIEAARVASDRAVLARTVVSSAPGNQWYPAVASDGTDALVVWQDARTTPEDIYGAIVRADGTVPPPADGTLLSASATGEQIQPAVATDGTTFFVVWLDRILVPGTWPSRSLYGARVTSSGALLDPAGILLSTHAHWSMRPAVAFGAGEYMAAAPNELHDGMWFVRISTSGTVLDTTPGSVMRTNVGDLEAAYDGSAFVFVSAENGGFRAGDVYGARIAPDGAVLNPSLVINAAPGGQLFPRIASNGAGALVVWTDDRLAVEAPYNRAILGALLNSSGGVSASEIVIAPFTHWYGTASVASDGADYFVAWGDARTAAPGAGIYGARVTSTGVVRDAIGIQIAAGGYDGPGVTYDSAGRYLAVWRGSAGAGMDLLGRWTTAAGAPLDVPFVVSMEPGDEGSLRLASDSAGGSLAVYTRVDLAPPYGTQRVRGRYLQYMAIDGGAPDAGMDAALPAVDGSPDGAGGTDAGTVDAASDPDARMDSGPASDSSVDGSPLADAGVEHDARIGADAGARDAAARLDGAMGDAGVDSGSGPPSNGEECSCRAAGAQKHGGTVMLFLASVSLLAFALRRRRGSKVVAMSGARRCV